MKQRLRDTTKRQELEDRLYRCMLKLKTVEDYRRFFADLCTPGEIEAMSDRWSVVGLLMKDEPYRAIAAETGVSLVTIGRVARSLHGDHKGYRLALERLGEWKEAE